MCSDATLHSLNAPAAFGDYNEAALSRPIHKYLREHINFAYLARSWAATNVQRSIVLITVPVDAETFCNQILMMDYSRQDIRWAQWPALDATCVASVIDATDNSRPKLYIGGSDGFVRRTDVANRSIDAATSIAAKVTTPYTNYGSPFLMKTLSGASLGVAQKNGDITFGWQCDTQSQQTATLSQAGGNILDGGPGVGFTLDDPVLGLLGGARFTDKFVEEAHGEYRAIQFQATQNGVDEDMELHSISTANEIGSMSMEN